MRMSTDAEKSDAPAPAEPVAAQEEFRSIDAQLMMEGAQTVGVLLGAAATAKIAWGSGSDPQQAPPPPAEPPPAPPADAAPPPAEKPPAQ